MNEFAFYLGPIVISLIFLVFSFGFFSVLDDEGFFGTGLLKFLAGVAAAFTFFLYDFWRKDAR